MMLNLVLWHLVLCAGGSSCSTCQEALWHAEELSYFGEFLLPALVHTVYIYNIYIYLYIYNKYIYMASPKNLFLSWHYHVLFLCLAPIVF